MCFKIKMQKAKNHLFLFRQKIATSNLRVTSERLKYIKQGLTNMFGALNDQKKLTVDEFLG